MIPCGEVGLIFAELGRTSSILSNEVYADLIIVIALSTLLSPILLKSFYRWFPPASILNTSAAGDYP